MDFMGISSLLGALHSKLQLDTGGKAAPAIAAHRDGAESEEEEEEEQLLLHACTKDAGLATSVAAGCQESTSVLGTYALLPMPGVIISNHLRMVRVSDRPLIVVLDNWLSRAECEALISLAEPHLERSPISGGKITPTRTSSSVFFTGQLRIKDAAVRLDVSMRALVKAACAAQGRAGFHPVEALQVVRYQRGEQYKLHYDNDDMQRQSGQPLRRAATVIVYLTDVAAGGETYFPDAAPPPPPAAPPPAPARSRLLAWHGKTDRSAAQQNPSAPSQQGVSIAPRAGRAVVFWSALPGGMPDAHSVHAAQPVLEGEKWIATGWFAEAGAQEEG